MFVLLAPLIDIFGPPPPKEIHRTLNVPSLADSTNIMAVNRVTVGDIIYRQVEFDTGEEQHQMTSYIITSMYYVCVIHINGILSVFFIYGSRHN